MTRPATTALVVGLACVPSLAAADQTVGDAEDNASLHSSVGWGQTVVPERISLTTEAGYDGAQQRTDATALVEAAIISRLGVFAAVTYGEETTGASRPAIGAAYQFTDPRTAAVGTRLSVAYKPEGFSEPEGEIETIGMFSHFVGRDLSRAFVAYGRDPDGHESDVEVGAGYLHPMADLFVVGVTTRYRYAIAFKGTGPRWDFIGGVVGDLAIRKWRSGDAARRWRCRHDVRRDRRIRTRVLGIRSLNLRSSCLRSTAPQTPH